MQKCLLDARIPMRTERTPWQACCPTATSAKGHGGKAKQLLAREHGPVEMSSWARVTFTVHVATTMFVSLFDVRVLQPNSPSSYRALVLKWAPQEPSNESAVRTSRPPRLLSTQPRRVYSHGRPWAKPCSMVGLPGVAIKSTCIVLPRHVLGDSARTDRATDLRLLGNCGD
jgi:hypothetical protein